MADMNFWVNLEVDLTYSIIFIYANNSYRLSDNTTMSDQLDTFNYHTQQRRSIGRTNTPFL